MSPRRTCVLVALVLAAPALGVASGCDTSEEPIQLGQGGAGSSSSGSGGAGGSAGPVDPASIVYPTIAALYEQGVRPTCSLNAGVCHQERQYPELGSAASVLATVGAPCQVLPASPSLVPDECERPGDLLVSGGVDVEILDVTIGPNEPLPPTQVTLRLATTPPTLDIAGSRIHRVNDAGQDIVSVPLGTVTLTQGAQPNLYNLSLTAAIPSVRAFLDTRVTTADRVHVGDPNGNGIAHASASPWALITPSDPSRSYLYKRLLSAELGTQMPLIERTWTPLATRALYCFIRGLSPDATPSSLSLDAPIDYENCPVDPDAPDPNKPGSWSSVRTLITAHCALSNCHSAAKKAGGLDLTPDAATFVSSVIQAPSQQAAGALLVVPGEPSSSYLFCKVDPSCDAMAPMTKRMPLAQPFLTAAQLLSLSTWIADGAKVE